MHLFILTLFIIILDFFTVLLYMLVCGHGDKAVKSTHSHPKASPLTMLQYLTFCTLNE